MDIANLNIMPMVMAILNTLSYIIIAAVAGGILYYFKYISSFNIIVEIMDKTSGNNIIRRDKARQYKDKTGMSGWQFMSTKAPKSKSKKIVDEPDSRYVDITKNGKKYCRFIRMDEDVYTPWHPNIPNRSQETFQTESLQSHERTSLIYQLNQSESKYAKKTVWEMLERAFPIIVIMLMLVGGLMLFDNITANIKEAQSLSVKSINQYQKQFLSSGKVEPCRHAAGPDY